MPLLSAGHCDVGKKRKVNQDSIYINPQKNLFVVADGMGGHDSGEIASQMAIKIFPEHLLSLSKALESNPIQTMEKAILHTNKEIKQYADKDENNQGMGTTLTTLFFKGAKAYLGNVGDSRTYLINKKRLYQLTRDHSLVQAKMNLGISTREQAITDTQKNILIRAVGFEDDLEVDTFSYKVHRNDIFLICSDGLYSMVSESCILETINHRLSAPADCTPEDLQQTSSELVQMANQKGGDDNISCIIVIAR